MIDVIQTCAAGGRGALSAAMMAFVFGALWLAGCEGELLAPHAGHRDAGAEEVSDTSGRPEPDATESGKDSGGGTDEADEEDSGPVTGECKAADDCAYKQCFKAKCVHKACAWDPDNGASCTDGRECDGLQDSCQGGKCVGKLAPAQACGGAGNAANKGCTVWSCGEPDGSCQKTVKPVGTTCDDGELCTLNTRCTEEGKCWGGLFICTCLDFYDLWEDEAGTQKNDSEEGRKLWSIKGIEKKPCGKWVSSGNACLGKQYCNKLRKKANGSPDWACEALPGTVRTGTGSDVVPCPSSDNACIANKCVKDVNSPLAGECTVTNTSKMHKCDDGDPCTTNDHCDGDGSCVGGVNVCKCRPQTAAQDCSWKVGDNACKGVYCDTSAGAPHYECKLLPSAEVKCNEAQDTDCQINLCDPKTGKCKLQAKFLNAKGSPLKSDGRLCDDGVECTKSETCFQGVCGKPDLAKRKKLLNDADPKNDHDPTGGEGTVTCVCKNDKDCVDKDNGDACDGTMYCDKIAKKCRINPATVVNCPSANNTACVVNFCYPSTGSCKMTPTENILKIIFLGHKQGDPSSVKYRPFPYPVYAFVPCDDNNPCTKNDECRNGSCRAGDTKVCACKTDKDCADDGDFCNGVPYCDKSSGTCLNNPSTRVKCSSINDTDCAKNVCDRKTGICKMTPVKSVNSPCSDGNPCTVGDVCEAGSCAAGTNICRCQSNADCEGQGTGNPCDGTLYCDKSGKVFSCRYNQATRVMCGTADDTRCLQNQCDKTTGKCAMKPAHDFELCDDGNPCSASPVCVAGTCYSESNLCQCQADADCAKFEDSSDKCAPTYYCLKDPKHGNRCMPKAKPPCLGSGDACFTFGCDPKTGACAKKPKSQFNACDDGNPCTVGDTCDGTKGECKPGPNLCACKGDADCADFDDGNPCNGVAFCDKAKQPFRCRSNPASVVDCSGNAKPDGSCLVNKCDPADGKCHDATKPGSCPDDGDPCTVEYCTADGKGCAKKSAPDGTRAGTVGTRGQFCFGGKAILGPAAMALVPAGTFEMGCSPNPDPGTKAGGADAATAEGTLCAKTTDESQHTVSLDAFWIGTLEVTVKRYKTCVDAGKCKAPPKADMACMYNRWIARANDPVSFPPGDDKKKDELELYANAAMTCVAHADAKVYCAWAADQEGAAQGVTKAGPGTLPSEAQWEYAARGGCDTLPAGGCGKQMRVFPWGLMPYPPPAPPVCATVLQGCSAVIPPHTVTETQAVGSKSLDRSVYGLFDVAGNAREWVLDGYDAAFYQSAAATKKNPVAPAKTQTVVRGGSFLTDWKPARLPARGKLDATKTAPDVGFRCVRSLK